ncbi:14294_t:CDS:2, partial [Gigaspora margarita]
MEGFIKDAKDILITIQIPVIQATKKKKSVLKTISQDDISDESNNDKDYNEYDDNNDNENKDDDNKNENNDYSNYILGFLNLCIEIFDICILFHG